MFMHINYSSSFSRSIFSTKAAYILEIVDKHLYTNVYRLHALIVNPVAPSVTLMYLTMDSITHYTIHDLTLANARRFNSAANARRFNSAANARRFHSSTRKTPGR